MALFFADAKFPPKIVPVPMASTSFSSGFPSIAANDKEVPKITHHKRPQIKISLVPLLNRPIPIILFFLSPIISAKSDF
jgi:hypothetical protein